MTTRTMAEKFAIFSELAFRDPSVLMTQMCRARVSPGRNGFNGQVFVAMSQFFQLMTVDCPAV